MITHYNIETSHYTVALPEYHGPLDLLLQLIERAELDITKIALAQVTHQFLEHLKNLEAKSAEEISGFLVIAAKLIQLKSSVLLPSSSAPDEEITTQVGDELIYQLKQYKKFKLAARFLDTRQASGLRTYLRLSPSNYPKPKPDLHAMRLDDLLQIAWQAFSNPRSVQPSLNVVIPQAKVTIRERIQYIADFLIRNKRTTFLSIIGSDRSRNNIIATFLAILELIKRHMIYVHQPFLFSDIEIETYSSFGTFEGQQLSELEFGE